MSPRWQDMCSDCTEPDLYSPAQPDPLPFGFILFLQTTAVLVLWAEASPYASPFSSRSQTPLKTGPSLAFLLASIA